MDLANINKGTEDELIINFRKAKKLYKKFLEENTKEYGLSQNEIEILMFLKRNSKQNTAKNIVEYSGISKGMISRTIDGLISKGIIKLEKDRKDKRIARLKIVENSKELIESLEKASTEFITIIFNGIPRENVKILEDSLKIMLDNLNAL
ncbi:MAG: MarR family winged helix-turn-helix transcriptional regulator [Sarcina sp.]